MATLVLPIIELATLIPGARLVTGEDNVEETWKAEVYAESGPTIAYVKMLEPQQVVSEVVCSLIGLALGLNIPKPFLVHVERENLPQSKKWNSTEQHRICFGSEDAKQPSFRQWVRANGTAVLSALASWNGYKQTAWFDEWIANDDRNVGNLLFDGKDFWLIDHSHALTGPNWTVMNLRNGKKVDNLFLASKYIATFDDSKKEQFKNTAGAESLRYQAIALDSLRECGMMEEYASEEQIEVTATFLSKRAESFMSLACDRLGIAPPLI